MKFISISQAIKKGRGKVAVRGWVYRERGSNKFKFIILRDNSDIIQCVLARERFEKQWEKIDSVQIEASVEIEGVIKREKRAITGYEIKVEKFKLVGESNEFPIQKDLNEELLGDRRHLWLRSKKMVAILKIRSTLLFALHEYLRKKEFIEVEAPSFSGATSEGGSETFEVKYFGKKAFLSQSWQFYAENIISAVEKAYAIAPSYRAEKSKTPRHLTEFWHCEVEAAWMNMNDMIKIGEEAVMAVIQKVIKENKKELQILEVDIKRLKKIKAPFPRITYAQAIKKLQTTKHKMRYGEDFGANEERDLAKYYGGNFLIVTNYPLEILKFYHGEDAKNPGTGMNFNILAPNIGEVIDGSQREPNLKKIKERLKKAKMDLGASDWYLDSRRYGSVPHAGFGLGTERFVQWICGLDNIKDAIPFPRTPTRISP
jgi:asparaginyl-tRNA synthetase